MGNHFMTLDDIGKIPEEFLPMMCLCNGFKSVFGLLISLRTKSFWNHFQWLVSPQEFASQWFWFRTFPVSHYRNYSLKLWYNPNWTYLDRLMIQTAIARELKRPAWETRYDVLGVIGQALGIRWFQRRNLDYCSEKIDILALRDPECGSWLKEHGSPTPEDVNTWLKDHSEKYKVYGRIMPG